MPNNSFYDVSKEFDCPIVIYNVDAVKSMLYKERIKTQESRYRFLAYQDKCIQFLESQLRVNRKNIFRMMQFSEIQAEDLEKQHNIAFIGSKFLNLNTVSQVPFTSFMESNPSEEERAQYIRFLDQLRKNPYLTEEEIFLQNEDVSLKIKQHFHCSELCLYLSDSKRVNTLSAVADLGLGLYGTRNWITDKYNDPNLMLSFNQIPVYTLLENQTVYNSSRIGINIHHVQTYQGMAWRGLDIMASSSCLVSEETPFFKQLFPKNIPIPLFTNPYEARKQCLKILTDENLRLDIIAASQELVNQSFRFKHMVNSLEEFIGISSENSNKKPVMKRIDFIAPKIKNNLRNRIRLKIYHVLRKKLQKKNLL